MPAWIIPLIEPLLMFFYKVLKDIMRGNPVKKRKKAGDDASKKIEDELERR